MRRSEHYSFERIFTLFRREKKEITAIYFYSIINGIIQITIPLGIQAILGYVIGATIVSSVIVLIIAIMLGVILSGFLQVLQLKIIETIKQKIFVHYAFQFAEAIPSADVLTYHKTYLPDKINFFLETSNIQKGLSKILIDIPTSIISIVLGLIIISLYHPLFIVFALVLIVLMVVIFRYTAREGIKTSIGESDNKYRALSWLEEMGRIIMNFKFSQGTHLNQKIMDDRTLIYLNAKKSHFQVLLLQYNFLVIFKVIITAFMLIFGSYLLFNQKINIGQFVAAELIIFLIISAIEKLIMNLDNIYDVNTGLYKLDKVLNLAKEHSGTVTSEEDKIYYDIDRLSFSYDDNTNVIHNLTTRIPANAITSIQGKANSGKSTLLSILVGLIDNFSGSVQVNNIPIQNFDKKSLRAMTGVYFNDNTLFNGSVKDNILLGKEHITNEEVYDLIKLLGFTSLLAQLPQGLDTMVYPLGKTLPRSTIKKLLLLRTFIHQPKLIVLEEPFLELDQETVSSLIAYINSIKHTKTIIIFSSKILDNINPDHTITLSPLR